MSPPIQFTNCRLCIFGQLLTGPLTISPTTGLIIPNTPLPANTIFIDLHNAIISPGFIELQINGALGFHFAHEKSPSEYAAGVRKLARYLPSTGVTSFFPTVPTVTKEVFKAVLPFLKPCDFTSLNSGDGKRDEEGQGEDVSEGGASILGAHVEGPFLAPSKKGAHDSSNMYLPCDTTLEEIYGVENLRESIRIVTLAPELPGALRYIEKLKEEYDIIVSMGHSAATFEEAEEGMDAGASLITHTFNAMNPLGHRKPGLAGLISHPTPPYYTIIADSIHLHPLTVRLAHTSSPSHTILITDSIELSGLPSGLYPGHAQIPHQQLKSGNKVTIAGTDTLVGTCIGLDECVRNLMAWKEIGVEEAVECVTENVVGLLGERGRDRGLLEVGKRADLVVLDEGGNVMQTWVLGKMVFRRSEENTAKDRR